MSNRLPVAVVSVAAVLAVAGCGGSGAKNPGQSGTATASQTAPSSAGATSASDNGEARKSPDQIVNDSLNALQQAGSAHMQGTINDNGQQVQIDLHLQGDSTAGTITQNGTPVDVVLQNGTGYAKAPQQFWAQQAGVPTLVGMQLDGKWVKFPADKVAQFNALTLDGLVKKFRSSDFGPSGSASAGSSGAGSSGAGASGGKVERGTLNGQPVLKVTQPDGTQVDVAATGKPYPLLIQRSGTEGGKITISEIGQPQNINAPSNALDIGALAGLASGIPTS